MSDVVGVVLAAGMGTRMKSETPKVLHEVAGRSLVEWVVQAAMDAGASRCVVVVGHAKERVEETLRARFGDRVAFAVQKEQRGTGHATACALPAIVGHEGHVLVLYGDCPLLPPALLKHTIETTGSADLGLVTARIADPSGYGRILRSDGAVTAIREDRDCSPEEKAILEVNPGVYCIEAGFLREAVELLDDDNDQGELYLTDLVATAAARGRVAAIEGDMATLRGVNDRWELAQVGQGMRARINEAFARAGVGIVDPATTYIDADCEIEPDATIHPGVHLRGKCRIEAGAVIDSGSVLTDVVVESGAVLLPYTVASESRIGPKASVGPFSHLRSKTDMGEGSKVGNFSETKKTVIGKGSKVNHLAYVGDGQIGEGVNVGAGVIFCNYDGVQKHTTTLEDGVFIGSDSQLVAPITVGKGAYVASGSTVTKDVPADALAVSRTRQSNKEGYASRLRARFQAAKKKG
ncbi:MAG: bifunctional UDP-N-acetylglucosamine diphosphorylase/glucosamine-1-phosphate N-acetyltransferase GlmU [Deltaproteobacteria bacterium]|nr:bifunctional UDP-N-acetylglucosamine diphosphorylase/glucosamine-1-phosphate N-acetyltransferase GlmU [Deltaproteobacteria bacterium]